MPHREVAFLPPSPATYEVAESAAEWRDDERDRLVPVRIYAPAGGTKRPVVVFSHGIGEDRDAYAWFGNALAEAGFMAVHVTHAGTDRSVLERGYLHLYRAVKRPENWVNRPLDVSFVLDRLAADPRADLDRVAVVGHSAGAFTAFALAGLRAGSGESLRDERVKAIVPMSMPRMGGVVPPDGYDDVRVPVLNVTGTCDASLIYRTLPRHRRRPFEATAATGHWLVTIRGVNHDTFSQVSAAEHELLTRLTIAFLNGFLLEETAAAAWFEVPRTTAVSGTELTIERK